MRVVATAGHVDHGKSTLVRALTGMEPDRWAEERRRGMTIDLGYAWTTLPSGTELAFVDVPGHQRFIANMLAGLGPAPAVLFVVAADEGWSRQSDEHLAAVDALQVRHGVLAVTRRDLADPAPALADASARLARTSLGGVQAVAVSGATGAGVEELRLALDLLTLRMPDPDPGAPVRLWVDRAFTIRGSGTVVTGTLGSGTVGVGDQLELAGRRVTVRSVQSLGRTRERVTAPARIALNLRGVGRDEVARGDVLLTPDTWHHTTEVDARLSGTAELPAELMLHVGTAAVPVRQRPLGADTVRIRLSEPLPLRTGDRAVLRDSGRQTVAAGVLVLDADPPALKRRGAAAARAAELATATATFDAAAEVARRGAMRRAHLRALGGEVPDGMNTVGDWVIAPREWRRWVVAVEAAVVAWAARNPLDPAIPLAALARELGLPDESLAAPVAAESGLGTSGGRVRLSVAPESLGAAEESIRSIEARLAADPFAAPDADVLASLRLGRRELAAAERTGRLLRLAGEVVLLPSAIEQAARLLGALPQPFTASQARQALGTTRRVVIPLLEHLDHEGRTERLDGAQRRVR
ncbi:MAG: translation elongation factor [Pseudonocardiales bacterium]|nr:translation elongation factor [Pseudonocardiales bacterium]